MILPNVVMLYHDGKEITEQPDAFMARLLKAPPASAAVVTGDRAPARLSAGEVVAQRSDEIR